MCQSEEFSIKPYSIKVLRIYLMKPYPRRNILARKENIYNYTNGHTRKLVENAHGKQTYIQAANTLTIPRTIVKIIKAACALNNYKKKWIKSRLKGC